MRIRNFSFQNESKMNDYMRLITAITLVPLITEIVYKTHSFKQNPMSISTALDRFIGKGLNFQIIVYSLNIVFTNRDIQPLMASLDKKN